MARLFESAWRNGYEFFERYYCTEQERSFSQRIELPHEWYEPSSRGLYASILDPEVKLDKKQGIAKNGRDQAGFTDPIYRLIRDVYWGRTDGDRYQDSPRVMYLDIETRVGQNSTGFPKPNKAAEEITLIQAFDNKTNTMFVFGTRQWTYQDDYEFEYEVKYLQFPDEISLLEAFVKVFRHLDPLIIYAWNGNGFDYPYIFNRMKNLGLDPGDLSVHGSCSLREIVNAGQTTWTLNSDGHFFIDLKDVYRKFVLAPRASYALDYIAEAELGERKVQHNEYAAFDDFYTGKYIIPKNPTPEQQQTKIYQAAIAGRWDEVRDRAHSEFVYYGVKDTHLIKRIDEKSNFTMLMLMIAEKMGVLIGDTLGTVKPWSRYIANKAHLIKQVLPAQTEHLDPQVTGGFVRDPIKGKHHYIVSADVNSMYPLLGMVGFNMSPETFVPKSKLPPALRDLVLSYFNDQNEQQRFKIPTDVWNAVTNELRDNNLALAINGAVFRKDQLGMIPQMVQDIYDSRKKAKRTMFEYEKRKILIKKILSDRSNTTG